jgi:hypothetical protein
MSARSQATTSKRCGGGRSLTLSLSLSEALGFTLSVLPSSEPVPTPHPFRHRGIDSARAGSMLSV